MGKGGAIISAILNHTMKENVAYMDIDLSAEPSELERLFEHFRNYDVVIGSRSGTCNNSITYTKIKLEQFNSTLINDSYSHS